MCIRDSGQGGQVQSRIADGGDLQVFVATFVDRVESEEGEEQVRRDTFGTGTVGHDQCRIDSFERPLGDDDRNFLDGFCHLVSSVFKCIRVVWGYPRSWPPALLGPSGRVDRAL